MQIDDFAERWPDYERRIRDHIGDVQKRHVLAIFANPNRSRLVGSGFLVLNKGVLYLVSAAHVFAEQDVRETEKILFFYTGLSTIQTLSGNLRFTKADEVDTGVLRLADQSPVWTDAAVRQPLGLEDMGGLPDAPEGEWFALIGFPESKNRLASPTRTLTAKPYGLVKQSASPDAYHFHGVTPQRHILLEFDQRATITFVERPSSRFPDPKGISGAPLWQFRFHGDGTVTSRVVGMAIEHRSKSKHKVIVCVRIEQAIHMIRRSESDLGR